MTIHTNDPRLTAYVLGELDAQEKALVEEALARSPELQAAVREIRETVGWVEEIFQPGPEMALTPEQIARVEGAVEDSSSRHSWTTAAWLKIAAALLVVAGLPVLVLLQMRPRAEMPGIAEQAALHAPAEPSSSDTGTAVPRFASPGQAPEPAEKTELDRAARSDTRIAEARQATQGGREGVPVAEPMRQLEDTAKKPSNERIQKEVQVVRLDPDKFQAPKTESEDRKADVGNQSLPVEKAVSAATVAEPLPVPPVAPPAPPPPPGAPAAEQIAPPIQGRSTFSLIQLSESRARSTGMAKGISSSTAVAPVPGGSRDDVLLDRPNPPFHTEGYDRIVDNDFKRVSENPLSTFSIDVDTASYSNMRRFVLQQGTLPPPDAVRIEELINYFSYEYPQPTDGRPFSVNLEAASAPWKPEHRLLRIGLKGRELQGDRPASNLVFLIDVSGSMSPENKLPLLRQAMRLVVEQLRPQDRVAIAVYAGASGMVLSSTPGNRKDTILSALERLEAGGSTNGAAGIELAYSVAEENRIEGGVNRVILATDGDFNVGVTDRGSLTRLIEEKAAKGVFLSVLGFGMGNYKDSTLEELADKGNGNYGYIDTLREARKLLVEQMNATLVTIAKDVKIQVEFNPAQVAAYRLIGYENRALANEDFNDDKKDAGEIGAGHTVTALYEVIPVGGDISTPGIDPLKYQQPRAVASDAAQSGEMLTVKLRYKEPEGSTSQLLEVPFSDQGGDWNRASRDFKFAAAVAGFGMLLRDSPHRGNATLGSVLELARESGTLDTQGYRAEFLQIVEAARRLKGQ